MIQQAPTDVESAVKYMLYAPPISHDEALATAKQYEPDLLVHEVSLEGESGRLFWEVEFEDDSYVAIDANEGHVAFTGVEYKHENEEDDHDDYTEVFGELMEELREKEYSDDEDVEDVIEDIEQFIEDVLTEEEDEQDELEDMLKELFEDGEDD